MLVCRWCIFHFLTPYFPPKTRSVPTLRSISDQGSSALASSSSWRDLGIWGSRSWKNFSGKKNCISVLGSGILESFPYLCFCIFCRCVQFKDGSQIAKTKHNLSAVARSAEEVSSAVKPPADQTGKSFINSSCRTGRLTH